MQLVLKFILVNFLIKEILKHWFKFTGSPHYIEIDASGFFSEFVLGRSICTNNTCSKLKTHIETADY